MSVHWRIGFVGLHITVMFGLIYGKTPLVFKPMRLTFPAVIYLLKVNNRNTRTRCEKCSKLTIKTLERRHWRRSGVFIVNCKHISHLFLVFL